MFTTMSTARVHILFKTSLMNPTTERLYAGVRAALDKPGANITEIARFLGVTVQTVKNWESREPSADGVVRAATRGVSAAWITKGIEPMLHRAAEAPSAGANTTSGPNQHGPYPLISTVQAGNWTSLIDNLQPGDAISRHHSAHNLGPHGYMLRVSGNSMTNPAGPYSFPDGMLLHVNPSLDPRPGQFVVVRRNGNQEATFKRYVLLEGEPYLEAINPDWPRELRFLKLQPGDDWCGVVVDASLGDLP